MNNFSKCAYLGLSEVVLSRKYCFILCWYSSGRFLVMFEIGPGLGCMSPLSIMILELFHV